jgi:drug/metabolite transporter (DMT)-like permease
MKAIDESIDRQDSISHVRGVVLVLMAGVIWSSIGVGVRSIEQANVWQILFYRSLAMSLFLFILISLRSRYRPVQRIRQAGFPGVIGGAVLVVAFAGGIHAIQTTTVANAMFLFAAAPFIAAVLGLIVLGERVRRATWIAMVFAFLGVFLMVMQGVSTGRLEGNIAALLSAVGFAMFTIVLRWKKLQDMLPAIFIAGLLAMVVSSSISIVQGYGLSIPARDVLISLALGVFQVGLGLAAYTTGSRVVPAAELALLAMTEVLLAPLWVWLFFGETASPYTLMGGGVLLIAIAGNALSGLRHKTLPVL